MRVSFVQDSDFQRGALQMTLGGLLGGLAAYGAWVILPQASAEHALLTATASAGAVVLGASSPGWRRLFRFGFLAAGWAAGLWWLGGSEPSLGALLLSATGASLLAAQAPSPSAAWSRRAAVWLASALSLLLGRYTLQHLADSELWSFFPLWAAMATAGAALGLVASLGRLAWGVYWGESLLRHHEDERTNALQGELRALWTQTITQRRKLWSVVESQPKAQQQLSAWSWSLVGMSRAWPSMNPEQQESLALSAKELARKADEESDAMARAEYQAAAEALQHEQETLAPLFASYRLASARLQRISTALQALLLSCEPTGTSAPELSRRLARLPQLLSAPSVSKSS